MKEPRCRGDAAGRYHGSVWGRSKRITPLFRLGVATGGLYPGRDQGRRALVRAVLADVGLKAEIALPELVSIPSSHCPISGAFPARFWNKTGYSNSTVLNSAGRMTSSTSQSSE